MEVEDIEIQVERQGEEMDAKEKIKQELKAKGPQQAPYQSSHFLMSQS
jgi:hypothetical protein